MSAGERILQRLTQRRDEYSQYGSIAQCEAMTEAIEIVREEVGYEDFKPESSEED